MTTGLVEEADVEIKSFDTLTSKLPNGNKFVGSNEAVKFSSDNYKNADIHLVAGKGANDFGPPTKEHNLEIADSKGESLGSEMVIDLDIKPTDAGGFEVRNPYPQHDMVIYVYGEKQVIKTGEVFIVTPDVSGKYAGVAGVESGAFYVQVDNNRAVKVSRKPLASEVTIKNFLLNKHGSGHEEYKLSPPNQESANKEVVWESDIAENQKKEKIFPLNAENTQDSESNKNLGQLRIDEKGRVILTPLEVYKYAYIKSPQNQYGSNQSGDITLTPDTYFRIGDEVFYFFGIENQKPKVVRVVN